MFQKPELTYQIEKNYFEVNFQGHELDYELREGFYVRSIAEADLSLAVNDVNDSKFL